MKIMIFLFSVCLLTISKFNSYSSEIGARAISLGKCFSSVSDDSTSVFWNPSGMVQILQQESGLFVSWKDSFTATAVSYVYPSDKYGYFGLGIYKIENLNPSIDTENSINISYSKYIHHNLSAGITLRNLKVTKDNGSGTTFNSNFGLLYKPLKNTSLGLSIENIGNKKFNYNGYIYNTPLNFKAGITVYFVMWRERLKIENIFPIEYKDSPVAGEKVLLTWEIENNELLTHPYVYRGLELWLGNFLGFRLGPDIEEFKTDNYWNCFFRINNPIIGLSLKLKGFQIDLSYGRTNYPISLSTSYKFGKKLVPVEYSKWQIEKNIQQYYRAGEKYYSENKVTQALTEWEKALIWDPENEELKKKIDDTRRELEAVANKKIIENYIEQAYVYYSEGKLLDSLDNWKEILKLDPENSRAKEYIEKINSKLTESEKRNGELREKEKNKLLIADYLRKGDIYFDKGEYTSAIEEWKKIIKINPEHQEAKENIINAEKKIIELVNTYFEQGVKLFNEQKYSDSAVEFRKVLKLNPEHSESKQYIEKIKNETTKKVDPKQIEQMYYTSADLYFAGKYNQSIEILNKLLKLDPFNKNAIKLLDKIKSIKEKL